MILWTSKKSCSASETEVFLTAHRAEGVKGMSERQCYEDFTYLVRLKKISVFYMFSKYNKVQAQTNLHEQNM